MDCLGLAGSKPTIPAPPKACPPIGLAPPIWPPVAPNPGFWPPAPAFRPKPALGSLGFPPALALFGSLGLPLGSEPPPPGLNAPDAMGVLMGMLPPPGPAPAITAPLNPAAPSGCPKNPIASGVFCCPNMMGFQSSLPVMGSTYFLRRKRMLLVLTSASILGG